MAGDKIVEFYLDGKQTIVMGGIHSIDRDIRLLNEYGWWSDVQLSEEKKSIYIDN